MKRTGLAFATCFGLALAAGAAAETDGGDSVLTSISPTALLGIVRSEGGEARLDDTQGDATIEGVAEGAPYSVFFYECDGGGFADPARAGSACLGYEYRAYFAEYPLDLEVVNEFNAVLHYGTLWLAEDDTAALQLSVSVEGGVTDAHFRTTYRWWRAVLGSFRDFMEGR